METLSYKIESFEGPMDLLLHLISKHKVRIEDVPIMDLINQYLDYMKKLFPQYLIDAKTPLNQVISRPLNQSRDPLKYSPYFHNYFEQYPLDL